MEINAPESPFYLAVSRNRRSRRRRSLVYEGTPRKKWDRKVFVHCSEECWPSKRGKKVTNHSVRKTLYFEAPWCWCSRELCSPTEWSQKYSPKSPPVLNTKRECPWPSAELTFLDPEMKRYQVSIIKVWSSNSLDYRHRFKFDNNYIDWSVKRSVTVFHRSHFYRCKHRIHQRVHIPNISRQCENCPEWKEASDCYR